MCGGGGGTRVFQSSEDESVTMALALIPLYTRSGRSVFPLSTDKMTHQHCCCCIFFYYYYFLQQGLKVREEITGRSIKPEELNDLMEYACKHVPPMEDMFTGTDCVRVFKIALSCHLVSVNV